MNNLLTAILLVELSDCFSCRWDGMATMRAAKRTQHTIFLSELSASGMRALENINNVYHDLLVCVLAHVQHLEHNQV